MKSWTFPNGIEVYEKGYDYDLSCFAVWDGDRYLGSVYPANIEDMQFCIAALDSGEDPISGGWDDGCMNPCTIEGWGDYETDYPNR